MTLSYIVVNLIEVKLSIIVSSRRTQTNVKGFPYTDEERQVSSLDLVAGVLALELSTSARMDDRRNKCFLFLNLYRNLTGRRKRVKECLRFQ